MFATQSIGVILLILSAVRASEFSCEGDVCGSPEHRRLEEDIRTDGRRKLGKGEEQQQDAPSETSPQQEERRHLMEDDYHPEMHAEPQWFKEKAGALAKYIAGTTQTVHVWGTIAEMSQHRHDPWMYEENPSDLDALKADMMVAIGELETIRDGEGSQTANDKRWTHHIYPTIQGLCARQGFGCNGKELDRFNEVLQLLRNKNFNQTLEQKMAISKMIRTLMSHVFETRPDLVTVELAVQMAANMDPQRVADAARLLVPMFTHVTQERSEDFNQQTLERIQNVYNAIKEALPGNTEVEASSRDIETMIAERQCCNNRRLAAGLGQL